MGGENSKLAFRKCVFRLAEQRNLPNSAEDAWGPFWLLPEGPHDVFSLVTPADIRRIRDHSQENFIKLADKVFDRLLVLKGTKDLAKNPTNTKQLLNCIRVLTRLIPFVYEARNDSASVEDILMWTQRPRPGSGEVDYVLGNELVAAVIDLLFTSGFTVPPAAVGEETTVRYTIWENGVGQTSSLGSSKEHANNRIEVLRLLMVLTSKTMYSPPAKAAKVPNRALKTIAYNSNKRMVLCLLCSFINTSLKDRAQGWAIPYRNNATMDPNDMLALLCMQTLFILLEYQKGDASTDEDQSASLTSPSAVITTTTDTGPHNLFMIFIAKLHRTQEFDYLISNIIRLLEESMKSNMSILASVTKQPARNSMPQEVVILLWMLLENNAPFKDYLVDHNRALRLFSILLYFMLNGYNDPAQAGMVRTTSHILHYLSEDSRFATRLMQPFDQSILPSTMRIVDSTLTHADFMINMVFTLLNASKPYLVPVYSNLLLLVRNVSPYVAQISQTTAGKLVSLFDIISSPAFIISEPYHVRWLIYLIEVFDYAVHYRAADNPHLMYSMVQSRSCFERLKNFDLDKAMAELDQLRYKKGKSEATRTIGGDKQAPSTTTIQEPENADADNHGGPSSPAISDKARGKRAEEPATTTTTTTTTTKDVTSSKPRKTNKGNSVPHFQPSAEWVFSWLPDLPLDPILAVLDALAVHVDRITEEAVKDAEPVPVETPSPAQQSLAGNEQHAYPPIASGQATPTATLTVSDAVYSRSAIISWLSSDAMVAALPDLEGSMPEIRPRLQGMTPALMVWFRSLVWSLVYGTGMKPFGIWKNTNVQLFVVQNAHRR